MECLSCKAWNEEDERRCVRCGRRLHLAAPRPAPDTYPVGPLTTATAPALQPIPGGRPMHPPAPAEPNPQPSLFRDGAALNGVSGPIGFPANAGFGNPKVIPIPMLTPARPPVERRKSQPRANAPRTPSRRTPDSQQSLDFSNELPAHDLGTKVEAVIYCDAPVALPLHRLIAAGIDASLIAIALGLFLSVFYLSGGRIVISKHTVPLFLAVIGVIGLFYRMLWCLGGGDSPGMRFAGLRLVNFDGRVPDRDQRGWRQAAYILSLLSIGLGLVWALVDEENLTWHDHISKTFPTPG